MLKQLVSDLGLEGHCVFLDFVAGARKEWLLRNARWFLLPSEHENFGVAVFEALVRQCPVVVSDQVYCAELLEPLARILPLQENRWDEFLRTRLIDEAYRAEVIVADIKAIAGLEMSKVAEGWADLLKSRFSQRVRE